MFDLEMDDTEISGNISYECLQGGLQSIEHPHLCPLIRSFTKHIQHANISMPYLCSDIILTSAKSQLRSKYQDIMNTGEQRSLQAVLRTMTQLFNGADGGGNYSEYPRGADFWCIYFNSIKERRKRLRIYGLRCFYCSMRILQTRKSSVYLYINF
jgi:hypothetical protein